MHLTTKTRDAFYWSIGTNGTIASNGIALIRLVIHWWNASNYKDLKYLRWLQAEQGCIPSIGTYGTIGVIRLVLYSWNASHYKDLECLRWLQAEEGCILLVHWYEWYDWYQWNCPYSIGVPLVKCISTLQEWRTYIAFSMCLGSHALRTKNRYILDVEHCI